MGGTYGGVVYFSRTNTLHRLDQCFYAEVFVCPRLPVWELEDLWDQKLISKQVHLLSKPSSTNHLCIRDALPTVGSEAQEEGGGHHNQTWR